jgi:ketosteroid isomerase-like protein
MRLSAVAVTLVVLACSCAGPGATVKGEPPPGAKTLVQAERAFAAAASTEGTRDAFLEYVAADAVIFRPGPVNAKEWYTEHTEVSGFLSWEPAYAEIAFSGDLGYTTGPWRYRDSTEEERVESFGQYVSVWRREGEGPWRVVADIGNVYDRPVKKIARVEYKISSSGPDDMAPPVNVEEEKAVLMETDRAFSDDVVHSGLVAGYMSFSTDDMRYIRMGSPAVRGKTKVRKALAGADTTVTWEPVAAEVSASGDLGYTYGTAKSGLEGPDGSVETSSYLRVWRLGPGRRWSVCLDIALPSGFARAD